MSKRSATGAVPPPDPIRDRVQAAIESVQSQRAALEAALAEMAPESRADALAPCVLDLLERIQGITAMLMPMAAHMDMLLRWRQEMEQWRVELAAKLLLGKGSGHRN